MNWQCKIFHTTHRVEPWNDKLSQLSVQRKFLKVTELEAKNCAWRRILQGLPAGQLSFLLRPGSDTLWTSLNLRTWRIMVDPQVRLPTVHHILSNCPTALTHGGIIESWKALAMDWREAYPFVETKLFADLPTLRAAVYIPVLIHQTPLTDMTNQTWWSLKNSVSQSKLEHLALGPIGDISISI